MSADLLCVKCGESETHVVDTRNGYVLGQSIRRRRECLRCGFRFTTYETGEHPRKSLERVDRARKAFTALQNALQDINELAAAPREKLS